MNIYRTILVMLKAILLLSMNCLCSYGQTMFYTKNGDSVKSIFGGGFNYDGSPLILDMKSQLSMHLSVVKNDNILINDPINYELYRENFGDSLLRLLNESTSDTAKGYISLQIARIIPTDSAEYYYNIGIKNLSNSTVSLDNHRALHLRQMVAYAYNDLATYIWNRKRYYDSFMYFDLALSSSKLIDDSLSNYSWILQQYLTKVFLIDDSVFNNYHSIYEQLVLKHKNGASKMASLYSQLANKALENDNNLLALKYAYHGIGFLKDSSSQNNSKFDLISLSRSIAKCYSSMSIYDSSIHYLKISVITKPLNSMDSSINKDIFLQIGNEYLNINYADSAIRYYQIADNIKSDHLSLWCLAKYYYRAGKPSEAMQYLVNSLSDAYLHKLSDFSNADSIEIAEIGSNIYAANYQFNNALDLYKRYCTAIISKHSKGKFDESLVKASYISYQYAKQKELYEIQNSLRKEREERIEMKNMITLGGTVSIILILLSVIYAYRIKQKKEVAELSIRVADIEMKALRSQMNPHFIFNALQSIQNFLLNHQSEHANEYLLKFSRLMRLVLENSLHAEVPLKDDLDALELYIQLESLRFTHPVKYTIIINESIDPESVTIPPLLLQPFVENAFWHGLQYKFDEGSINIRIEKVNDAILCTVEDNGVGRSYSKALKGAEPEKKSLGMSLTRERIDLFNKIHGTQTDFKILDLFNEINQPAGTRIELFVPIVT